MTVLQIATTYADCYIFGSRNVFAGFLNERCKFLQKCCKKIVDSFCRLRYNVKAVEVRV